MSNRFYCHLMDGKDIFVSEAAYHLDEERDVYLADVLIHAPCRDKGYGSQALELLCKAAKASSITFLFDDIAADTPYLALFLFSVMASLRSPARARAYRSKECYDASVPHKRKKIRQSRGFVM